MSSQQTAEMPEYPWDAFRDPAPTAHPPANTDLPDNPWDTFGPPVSHPEMATLKPQDLISKIYHPVITGTAQMLGASAGAIAGTAAEPGLGTIAGGIAGGAAMYPPAEGVAKIIDQYRGIQPPESTLGQDVKAGLENELGGRAMGPVLGLAGKGVNAGFKKVISAFLGPSTEAISARMANPDLMNTPSFSQIAYKIPKTLALLKEKISTATDAASNLLRSSPDVEQGAIPASKITGMIQNLSDDLQTSGVMVGAARKAAGNQLSQLTSDVGKILKPEVPSFQLVDQSGKVIPWSNPDAMLPESTVKDVLQAVRKNINWDDAGLSETNSALTHFSGELDAMLKTGNPKYAEAMKPISEMMGNLDDTMQAFSLTKRTGEGIQPTDATISKLQSVVGDKKSISQDVLNELASFTGQNHLQQAKDYAMARQFENGTAQGSRKVNLGLALGGPVGIGLGSTIGHPAIGGLTGEAAGAVWGALADKFGGQMAGAIIDKYTIVNQLVKSLSETMPAEAARRIAVNAVLGGQGKQ